MYLRIFFCFLMLSNPWLLAHAQNSTATRDLNILTSFPPDFYGPFKKAFEAQNADIKVSIRNKKTTAGIAYLQRESDPDIDLFWASAPDAFSILHQSRLLADIQHIEFLFPPSLHEFPLKSDAYLGFALSGYGIMLNKQYLKSHGLSMPKSWADLANAEYYSHLALSSPSRSGTTHLMIETILQFYGWQQGWKLLLQIASNAATITARSYGVPEGVEQGRFGLGLVIDFLSQKIDSDNIHFIYASETQFLPASIALLKKSRHKDAAEMFIQFVLSPTGQKLLRKKGIARLPIDPAAYADKKLPLNPYSLSPDNSAKTFDPVLSQQRYTLVNLLFDHFVTFRLNDLNRIRSKLIQAQQKLSENKHKNTQRQAQLQQAQKLLSSMPLSLEQSQDPNLLLQLKQISKSYRVSGYLPQSIAKLKLEWSQTLHQAEAMIEKILASPK